jgi:DNA-binding NtrC family response regulator
MKEKILIVEDQFVEADYLRLMLVQAGYYVTGIARSVQIAQDLIEQEKPDLVLVDIFLKGKLTGIELARQLKEDNIAFIYLSANSDEEILAQAKATQPYGFLVKPFREKDLLITLEIARYRHEHSLETSYRKEAVLQRQLVEIISREDNWEQKLLQIGSALQPYIPFDYIAAGFNTVGTVPCYGMSFLRVAYDEYQKIGVDELLMITGLSLDKIIRLSALTPTPTTAMMYNDSAFENHCSEPSLKKLFAETFQLKSHLSLPVMLSTNKPFSFCLYSRRSNTYNPGHIALYNRLQQLLNTSVERMLKSNVAYTTITNEAGEGPGTDIEPGDGTGFVGIIGRSHLLLNVFDEITQVAPSDTSVLIMGESGTGKERIADCIHNLSTRKGMPFIKVNCAALPTTLIESELFGHEKGSFTGATERRIGKFEQADRGTIFLDEIGEMPIELQVKLLRVLQEKEIERIGSRGSVKINVRIIAATNRNLEKEVAEGRFRLDLYYRLNVFPIVLPSLRERKEDMPLLAAHFIRYYNRKTGKKINGISDRIMKSMLDYNWPGNVRELEHMIERSVLLEKGTTIQNMSLPIARKETPVSVDDARIKTIHENERDHILNVLKKCNGRIWGPGAAAELLNIPPSTLKSRMKKLGIKKQYIE